MCGSVLDVCIISLEYLSAFYISKTSLYMFLDLFCIHLVLVLYTHASITKLENFYFFQIFAYRQPPPEGARTHSSSLHIIPLLLTQLLHVQKNNQKPLYNIIYIFVSILYYFPHWCAIFSYFSAIFTYFSLLPLYMSAYILIIFQFRSLFAYRASFIYPFRNFLRFHLYFSLITQFSHVNI